MSYTKGDFLYEGKAKALYKVKGFSDLVWMEFKDNLTAFNGKKQSSFKGKGALNRNISSILFRFLKKEGVPSHWKADVEETAMVCHTLDVTPLEVVVRNRLAGSTAKRFNFPEGKPLSEPLVEFYYKKDELGDPFMSLDQAVLFGFLSHRQEGEFLKTQALKVNKKMQQLFNKADIELIDFKLEFGKIKNSSTKEQQEADLFLLGDEISCDSCRLWDKQSGEKLDKDRFRLNLGGVEKSYKKVHSSLKQTTGY